LFHLKEAGCIGVGACYVYLGKGLIDAASVNAEGEELGLGACGLWSLS